MGKVGQFVTFEIELILFVALVSSTLLVLSAYFNSVLRIPPVVFMFVYAICAMLLKTIGAQIFVFSSSKKVIGSDINSTVLADVSQGFAVVSSVLWVGLILLMFIDVPRITSVPDYEPENSMVAMAVAIGFTIFIPFLAIVVCYTAVPEGRSNSLVFNGSTVGVFSLLFFVLTSFGSGGVMKCGSLAGSLSGFIFTVLVCSYFVALYVIEMLDFYRWNPFKSLMSKGQVVPPPSNIPAIFKGIHFNVWRIPGAVVNGVIILSTIPFSHSPVHGMVVVVLLVVLGMHVPLIISIKFDHSSGETVPTAIPAGYDAVPSYEPDQPPLAFPTQPTYPPTYPPGYTPADPSTDPPVDETQPQPTTVIGGLTSFTAKPRSFESNYFGADSSYGDALRKNAATDAAKSANSAYLPRQRRNGRM
jgi:hypothetical protein